MISKQNIRDIYDLYIQYAKNNNLCRKGTWKELLKIDDNTKPSEIIRRAILSCAGNFNYWEENGQIAWPNNMSGTTWFEVIVGERDIKTMNIYPTRMKILARANKFINQSGTDIKCLYDNNWWNKLHDAFGLDPLKKRETLLYIILTELGINDVDTSKIPCQNMACIDYNIIIALRYAKAVTGFTGNIFDLKTETKLRYDCLQACEEIFNISKCNNTHQLISIGKLDNFLYSTGRYIRHNIKNWEDFMCYRFGCYFY